MTTRPTRVLATGADIRLDWLEFLRADGLEIEHESQPLGVEEIYNRLQGFDYYLYGGVEAADQLESSHFDALQDHGLKMIAFAGKGVTDFLNVRAASDAGIVVTNTPGAVEPSVAEFTVLLILASLRNAFQRALKWLPASGVNGYEGASKLAEPSLATDLSDVRVGIIGMGDIGELVARSIRNGFGAEVAYFSRTRKPGLESELGATFLPLDELVAQCDVISLHLANNQETRDLIANTPFEAGSGAVLVNTASEGLMEPERLAKLLDADSLACAAFDKIYSTEILAESGLISHVPARLLVTNHSANATESAWKRMSISAGEDIARHHRGERAEHVVEG